MAFRPSVIHRFFLFIALCPALLIHAVEPDADLPESRAEPPLISEDPSPDEPQLELADLEPPVEEGELIQSLLRIAERKHGDGLHEDARIALNSILERDPDTPAKVQTFLLLADSYRATEHYTRAAAILEKVMEDYPGSPMTPRTLLSLGRVYRDMGLSDLAVSRFYAVLNATLKLSPDHLDDYQLLARTAQFEIAETHLLFGRFDDASEYFRRLSLLDLAPEDRARAQFKVAYAVYLGQDDDNAVPHFRRFLAQNPDSQDVPEALYLLSLSLERQDRHQESLSEALKLFEEERVDERHGETWRYWQRRAGNHLANEFFRNGRMEHALQLYTQLARITPEPEWKAPALYQVGLSAERLGDYRRARAAYSQVVELADESSDLDEIGSMARWRRDHLDWARNFDTNRQRVIGSTAAADVRLPLAAQLLDVDPDSMEKPAAGNSAIPQGG